MSKKIKQIAALFITLILVGLMPFASGHNTAYAAKDERFKVEVHYGYNDRIQVRCYVPFYITIENTGDNFEGTVQVITTKNEYNIMYEKDISIAKGTKKTVVLTVPIENYIDRVNVRIVNQKDKVVFSDKVKCNVLYSLKELNIGILSDDFTALSYMSGQPLFGYSDITTKIYELNAETMPDEWMALQMLDAVIITNYSTDKLTEAQVKALGSWVEEGGLLVIGTGSTANKTLAALNGNVVDVKTGELKTYSTKFGYSLVSYMSDTLIDGNVNRYYFEISDVAVNTINKLIEEYIDANLDMQSAASMAFDYEVMFNEFYELNKDTILQLCKTDFIKSVYGMSSMSDAEWENYGEDELYYNLYAMYETKFAAVREKKIMEFMSVAAGNLSFEEADVLELEVAKNSGNYTVFYGETAQKDKLFPLITAVSRGDGYIAVAGIDFTQNPFCTYKGNSAVFTNVVKTLIGQKVYEKAMKYTPDYYYDDSFDYYIRETVDMAASAAAPPVLLYVIIIGVYLILCLTVFFVLRKKKKNMHLWVVQPVMAVVFAFIIYLAGFTTRIIKPELNVVALTQLEDNYEQVNSYATLMMPKNKSYKVAFSKSYSMELANLERNWYYGNNSQQNSLDSYYLGIHGALDFTEIEVCNTQSLSTETFELNKSGYIDGGFVTDFNEAESLELRGNITNNYGVTIEDAFVYYNQKFFAVGDIAAGETVEITDDTPSFYADMYYRSDYDYEQVFGESRNNLATILFGDSSNESKREQMKKALFWYAKERMIHSIDSYKGGYNYGAFYPGAILFGFPSEVRDRNVLVGNDMEENIYEMVYVKIGADKIDNSSVLGEYGIKYDIDVYYE